MSIDIRQPNITASDSAQQLLQMRSYLYQLSEQLNWAFSAVDSSASGGNVGNAIQVNTAGSSKEVSTEDAVRRFNDIKALIIKSADIVEAYSQVIEKKIASAYVAQSDFADYMETNIQNITVDGTSIAQQFERIQAIDGKVSEISSQLYETNAYIKTGLLDESKNVYGLEIGQRNELNGVVTFDRYARFTADKLSFYNQSGAEIAYVSGNKMHISQANITDNLTLLEKFEIKVAGNGCLAFKYIGG